MFCSTAQHAVADLQGAGLDLKLVAVPVHLLLLRQLLKQVAGDDVLSANQAGIWLVRVIDDALPHLLIGAGTEVVCLHLRHSPLTLQCSAFSAQCPTINAQS